MFTCWKLKYQVTGDEETAGGNLLPRPLSDAQRRRLEAFLLAKAADRPEIALLVTPLLDDKAQTAYVARWREAASG